MGNLGSISGNVGQSYRCYYQAYYWAMLEPIVQVISDEVLHKVSGCCYWDSIVASRHQCHRKWKKFCVIRVFLS